MTTHVSMEMSGSAASRTETTHAALDQALAVLRDHAKEFARLDPARRAALLRDCVEPLRAVARRWVEAAAQAKGLSMDAPAIAEEWMGGPMTTLRNVRLLIRSLDDIRTQGRPVLAS